MTEEITTPDAATETSEQEATSQPKPTETVDFWKQKAREQEKRAKENAEAATKLREFEDRDKTEAQKLTERAEAAERRAIEVESHAMRLEIAAEKGLTPVQAKRLVGATREELEADADELLETFKPANGDQSAASNMAADLDLGARGTASTSGDPKADFVRFLNQL